MHVPPSSALKIIVVGISIIAVMLSIGMIVTSGKCIDVLFSKSSRVRIFTSMTK